jgi:N-acetylglucosamine kinase-like BadF-type ATPase
MRYVIGVDGGGTKTVCALANENGEILNISMAGCTNHQICGFETAIQRLTELILCRMSRNSIVQSKTSSQIYE